VASSPLRVGCGLIRFGEITFTPGNACLRFLDFKLDKWLGGQFGKNSKHGMPWDFGRPACRSLNG
jgi:hypothetical protein